MNGDGLTIRGVRVRSVAVLMKRDRPERGRGGKIFRGVLKTPHG